MCLLGQREKTSDVRPVGKGYYCCRVPEYYCASFGDPGVGAEEFDTETRVCRTEFDVVTFIFQLASKSTK